MSACRYIEVVSSVAEEKPEIVKDLVAKHKSWMDKAVPEGKRMQAAMADR